MQMNCFKQWEIPRLLQMNWFKQWEIQHFLKESICRMLQNFQVLVFLMSHVVCMGMSRRWSKPILMAFFSFFSHPLINTQYLFSTKLSDDENPVHHQGRFRNVMVLINPETYKNLLTLMLTCWLYSCPHSSP